jgi:hypothetical protein
MGVGIGVKVKLFHTGRRTSMGERVADALSKGNMKEVMNEMPDGIDVSERSSKVLMNWIRVPRVDRALGRKGLLEVAGRCNVELGRDYAADYSEIMGNHKEGNS